MLADRSQSLEPTYKLTCQLDRSWDPFTKATDYMHNSWLQVLRNLWYRKVLLLLIGEIPLPIAWRLCEPLISLNQHNLSQELHYFQLFILRHLQTQLSPHGILHPLSTRLSDPSTRKQMRTQRTIHWYLRNHSLQSLLLKVSGWLSGLQWLWNIHMSLLQEGVFADDPHELYHFYLLC